MEAKYAKILWDYHHMNQVLQVAECILALGSHDVHVAERASELFLEGYANIIVFTGGFGRITKEIWKIPEAQKFRDIAISCGVPKENILIEYNSTNTGENILNTWILLKEKNLNINSFILVDKPYKERRAYATFNKQWPVSAKILVTSPQYTFEEYCKFYKSGDITIHDFISIMVGDLQRIDLYGKKGFQTIQKIPAEVWEAYDKLVEMGFTEHLITFL